MQCVFHILCDWWCGSKESYFGKLKRILWWRHRSVCCGFPNIFMIAPPPLPTYVHISRLLTCMPGNWLEIEVIAIPHTSNFISSNKSSPKCCIKANSPQYDVWHIFSKKILFPPTCPHENLSPKNTVCAFATILKYDTLPSSNTIFGAVQ